MPPTQAVTQVAERLAELRARRAAVRGHRRAAAQIRRELAGTVTAASRQELIVVLGRGGAQ